MVDGYPNPAAAAYPARSNSNRKPFKHFLFAEESEADGGAVERLDEPIRIPKKKLHITGQRIVITVSIVFTSVTNIYLWGLVILRLYRVAVAVFFSRSLRLSVNKPPNNYFTWMFVSDTNSIFINADRIENYVWVPWAHLCCRWVGVFDLSLSLILLSI